MRWGGGYEEHTAVARHGAGEGVSRQGEAVTDAPRAGQGTRAGSAVETGRHTHES